MKCEDIQGTISICPFGLEIIGRENEVEKTGLNIKLNRHNFPIVILRRRERNGKLEKRKTFGISIFMGRVFSALNPNEPQQIH